jgi:hypothetical protein
MDFPPVPVWLDTDPRQMEEALHKLLECASRSNDPRDTLRLTIEREGSEVVLRMRPHAPRQETPSTSPVDLSRRE